MTAAPLPVDEKTFRSLLNGRGAEGRLADVLAPLPEAARAALAPVVLEEVERSRWSSWSEQRVGLVVGILGCCGPARTVARELRTMWFDAGSVPLLVRVLRERSPRWLAGLPSAMCRSAQRGGEVFHRPLLRALVREGLVEPPTEDLYLLSLPQAIARSGTGPALGQLRQDPGLVEELFACFRLEGVGRALADTDTSLPGGWMTGDDLEGRTSTVRHALLTLTAEGTVDRDRLLDETLVALLRDWPDRDVPWFAGLHEALAPTVEETARREASLRRVLAAPSAAAVSLAQRRLAVLLEAGVLDVAATVEASRDVLLRGDVAPVKAQLTFLAAVARAHPGHRAAVADVAGEAREHPKPAVAERAAALAAKLATPTGAPVAAQAPPAEQEPVAPGPPFPALPPPPAAPVRPVASADELLDVLTRLLEEADDPVEVERALDALPRFARVRPRPLRAEPRRALLSKLVRGRSAEQEDPGPAPLLTDDAEPVGADALVTRARALVGDPSGQGGPWEYDLRLSIAALALGWLDGRLPGPAPATRELGWTQDRLTRAYRQVVQQDWTVRTVLARRLHETAEALARGGGAPLSLPTLSDGSLDPEVLAARLAALDAHQEPAPVDAGLAALRVPPARRADVVLIPGHRACAVVGGHLARLGQHVPRWEPVTGTSPREHDEPLAPAIAWADTAAPQGSTSDPVAALLDRREPLAVLGHESTDGDYNPRHGQAVALWPLMLPHDVERLTAHGLGALYRTLDKDRGATGPLLAAIGRAPGPAGPVACAGLALALSARTAPDRTRAVDALLDLAVRGCLDGTVLGTEVVRFLTAGVTTGSRVAQALDEALTADPVLAHPLTDLAVTLLPVLPGRKDAHLFVAVAGRAARLAGRALTLPEPFEALRSGSARSGLAAACRTVPAP